MVPIVSPEVAVQERASPDEKPASRFADGSGVSISFTEVGPKNQFMVLFVRAAISMEGEEILRTNEYEEFGKEGVLYVLQSQHD